MKNQVGMTFGILPDLLEIESLPSFSYLLFNFLELDHWLWSGTRRRDLTPTRRKRTLTFFAQRKHEKKDNAEEEQGTPSMSSAKTFFAMKKGARSLLLLLFCQRVERTLCSNLFSSRLAAWCVKKARVSHPRYGERVQWTEDVIFVRNNSHSLFQWPFQIFCLFSTLVRMQFCALIFCRREFSRKTRWSNYIEPRWRESLSKKYFPRSGKLLNFLKRDDQILTEERKRIIVSLEPYGTHFWPF